ncbi:MAG: alpha/beta fold hydrolase, partial [Acidobacteria bacterium]|nr:alpha/beta fold hydrolase [Acidobacteriota bacterium]
AICIADALRPIASTRIPDLNQPSFRALTVTRMIATVREELDAAGAGPAVLIGSSLGAFVAVHAAAADARVKGLVLLAPALDFGADENDRIGTVSIADWRAAGSCEVFHYAWGRQETLDFALYEDARRHDAFALALAVPVLIFQGTRDAVVDPAIVRRWAAGRPGVRLVEVDDDHQLQSSVDRICRETAAFVASLGSPGVSERP